MISRKYALKKLIEIIEEEETEFKLGGSEDSEGTLMSGNPDFEKIRIAAELLFDMETDNEKVPQKPTYKDDGSTTTTTT